MFSASTEVASLADEQRFLPISIKRDDLAISGGSLQAREIVTWMRALRSFFNLYNHPFSEANRAGLVSHDWTNELRIVRGTLLRCSQLVFSSVHFEKSDNTIFDEADAVTSMAPHSSSSLAEEVTDGVNDSSLFMLATTLGDGCALCQSLLELPRISLPAWFNVGEELKPKLDGIESSNPLGLLYSRQEMHNVPASLLELTRETVKPVALGADILSIFSGFFRRSITSCPGAFSPRFTSCKRVHKSRRSASDCSSRVRNASKSCALLRPGLRACAIATTDC